jgi:hypothetical protein
MSEPLSRPHYPSEALRLWQQHLPRGPLPDDTNRLLCELIDTLFFASLGKEEGEPTLVNIAYYEHGAQGLQQVREYGDYDSSEGPRLAWQVIPFELSKPLEFNPKRLLNWAKQAREVNLLSRPADTR